LRHNYCFNISFCSKWFCCPSGSKLAPVGASCHFVGERGCVLVAVGLIFALFPLMLAASMCPEIGVGSCCCPLVAVVVSSCLVAVTVSIVVAFVVAIGIAIGFRGSVCGGELGGEVGDGVVLGMAVFAEVSHLGAEVCQDIGCCCEGTFHVVCVVAGTSGCQGFIAIGGVVGEKHLRRNPRFLLTGSIWYCWQACDKRLLAATRF
jgi:hypothetical protein